MTDIEDLWKQIEKAFDADENMDVDSFLKQKGLTTPLLAESVSSSADAVLEMAFTPELLTKNTKLSKYKILKQINSGGQSEIYLAQRSDGVYEKTVVIKFIALRYAFDTLKQQFLQEMQLLADLNHPGIVQILDGGITKEDQPWLVLNYIDGLHIDEYCKQEHLSHKQIIKLFLDLCEALNFVHLRGVVHMDIKASNILINNINNIPYPVIIDFGISNRAEKSEKNGVGQVDIFGTAGFSAPEQIAGQKLDHRADIYSLGMMLSQLLIKDETCNIGILDVHERNSLLKQHKVDKDLIQIIQKTTKNNPNNRYKDIDSLRLDLNSYLYDLPLLSQQSHFGHILIKTYKRHKIASLISFIVLLTILGFSIKYTNDIATQQQLTAEAKNDSDELFNFMLTDLFTNLSQIGRIDILKQVTEKSIEHLKKQEIQLLDDKSQFQYSVAYTNAGQVFDALGSSELALDAYEKGIRSLENLANNPMYEKSYLSQLALIKNQKGLTLSVQGQQELTEKNLLESLLISEKLLLGFPDEDLELAYEAHTQLGWYYMEYENPQKALKHIESAIETANIMNQRKLNYHWIFNLSQAYQVLAWYQFDYGDPNTAVITINKAISLANRTVDESGESIIYFSNQLTLINQLNFFYLENKQPELASKTINNAIAIGESLQQQAPMNKDYLRELAYSYSMVAQLAEQQEDYHKSLEYYSKGLEISKLMNHSDKNSFSNANDYANDLIHVGIIHEKLSQLPKAKELWIKAIDIMKPVHLLEPNNKYYTNTLIIALIKAGEMDQAKPLILELKQSGFNDNELEELLIEHNLNTLSE
jgi:serine/threonine-protein kinase